MIIIATVHPHVKKYVCVSLTEVSQSDHYIFVLNQHRNGVDLGDSEWICCQCWFNTTEGVISTLSQRWIESTKSHKKWCWFKTKQLWSSWNIEKCWFNKTFFLYVVWITGLFAGTQWKHDNTVWVMKSISSHTFTSLISVLTANIHKGTGIKK